MRTMWVESPATVPSSAVSRVIGWDGSLTLPMCKSSVYWGFARDEQSAVKTRAWVEEIIGERLPQGTFGEAFKSGVGLCRLMNAIKPGAIPKIETSCSPFKQMANISAFLQFCRKLGVREHTLFETLDLFNEKRLDQVVCCLFSLSELVRTTMSEFPGPYLSAPDKPEVDPAIKAVVEIAKGNLGPLIPARQNTGGSVANGAGAGGGGSPCTPASFPLTLPHPVEQAGGGCLLPAGPAVRLTYGVYEGGGQVKTTQCAGSNDTANGSGGSRSVKPHTSNEIVARKDADADKRCGGSSAVEPGGAGTGGGGVAEFAESTMPVVHTPRVMPTPSRTSVRGEQLMRTYSPFIVRTPRELSGSTDGKMGKMTLEEVARRKRETTARMDAELEVALWMEGVTGVTFPGKFWSSLKDGVLLCTLVNTFQLGIVPHVNNNARAPFPEMENITAFLAACRVLGVPEHSLFDIRDLHEKKDMEMVMRCIHALADVVQSSQPDFKGPFLGKRTDVHSRLNARGLRKQLGKGPGARGGIHDLDGLKAGEKNIIEGGARAGGGGGAERAPAADVQVEHMDPTATVTPADSPSLKKANCAQGGSDSAAGSNIVSPLHARPCGNGDGDGAAPSTDAGTKAHAALEPYDGVSSSMQRRRSRRMDRGESVVSQIQAFIEHNTNMPWRIRGDMYESLRDGWQLCLLANALRPNAIRRVHNSIQPARQVQNIANFLIASRRMGVARALLFETNDLYANRNMTRVARTLLALRALSSDPDFTRERASALANSSLLVSAVTAAHAKTESSPSAAPTGPWS